MRNAILVLAIGFILYNVIIAYSYGILNSISESYYALEKRKRGYIFTLFMWFMAGCLIWISGVITHYCSWTFFVAGIGAAFVGGASTYYQKITKPVHYSGATILILFTAIGLWGTYDFWYPIAILTTTFPVFWFVKIKNSIYWYEMLAFTSLIIGLFLTS